MSRMTEWERKVTQHLDDSEYYFLSDYDRWLRAVFGQIPIGADEHTIHAFHLMVGQRLSSILAKHSIASFTSGQAQGDEDCKAILDAHKRKLADLPKIIFSAGNDFTPHDAIKVLQNRAIALAGDVENDATAGVKSVLLKHLTGELTRPQTEQQIAALLKGNMNRASLIVTTETTYAYNHGRLMQYRSHGADYVQYRAVMDGRTCQICASRNGLVAPIDAIGGDIPPVHGRCRCVLSPVFGSLQSQILTPEALDWSKVVPLPKGWVPEDALRASGKVFSTSGLKGGKIKSGIDIFIDAKTRCLVDRKTGQVVKTEYKLASKRELNKIDWNFHGEIFDWLKPLKDGSQVYKLTVQGDNKIQGLIAMKPDPDNQAYFVDLVQNNPQNIGSDGRYEGVGAHLFAIAAKHSFADGFDGYVYFDAKTRLIDHYTKELGARMISGQRMYIDTVAARALFNKYFGGGSSG